MPSYIHYYNLKHAPQKKHECSMPLKVGPHIRIIVGDICLTGIFTTWKRKVNIEQVFEQSSNKLRRIPSISNTNRKFGRETGKIETDGQLKDVKAGEKMVT